ncbi:MAG: serine/threonine-protein kinase, partial [Pyrinomonadaceae bacterium]
MSIPLGLRLGRYEITSPLGAGGMGEVYLAQDTELGRTVALKVLPSDLALNEKSFQRFVQEAKAVSALSHPNIVTIHEIGQADGVHFIAIEYIEGVTLRTRMQRGAMTIPQLLDVASQVAGALIAAHAAGIVHRDIKPENIMLRHDGFVKVLDFGLCTLMESDAADPNSRTLVLSDPNVLLGTPVYMSAEQVRGQKVDGRTDIWSLGVVLYEMVAGRAPFEGGSVTELIVSILERE